MSDIRKDGGAAFPLGKGLGGANEGMSLRDWFAGAALQGAIASPVRHQDTTGENITSPSEYAELAYSYADAMIAQREKS